MNRKTGIAALFLLAAILASPQAKPIRIACVGDSITYGSMLPERERWAFPARLQGLLAENAEVQNFGVPGATLLTSGDIPYAEQDTFKKSLRFKPNLVFIMLGTNDSKKKNWLHKDAFEKDYHKLIKSYRKLPTKPRIILLSPLPAFMDGEQISGSRIDRGGGFGFSRFAKVRRQQTGRT